MEGVFLIHPDTLFASATISISEIVALFNVPLPMARFAAEMVGVGWMALELFAIAIWDLKE